MREELKAGTALGLEAEKLTSLGQLAPDHVINALVESWLSRHAGAFVFDGYPRSHGQATALETLLTKRGTPLDVVLSLEADQATISDRVSRRMMCSHCGNIVSIGLHVVNENAPCPICGERLVKRSDDTPETLELRMREYEVKTASLIPHFRERGLLRSVDARHAPEVVFRSIVFILESA